ncbi:MAG: hypothetical protein ACHQZR_08690 [Candidatus Limnocylindrales bacterium]
MRRGPVVAGRWPRLASCEVWFAHGAGTPDARTVQAQQIETAIGVAPVRIPWWDRARPAIVPTTDLDRYLRDRFVGAPPSDVHPGPGGIYEPDLGDPVSSLARPLLRRFYHGAIPMLWRTIADAVYYLHHGEAMRADLLAWMASQPARDDRPRLAVGLSLGGLLLVDALTAAPQPYVDALVTLGSQAPLIYQTGGLTSLPRAVPPPTPFRPWLNVWDPDDYMSFPMRDVFGADPRLVDRLIVDPTSSFPDNHSNYFDNPEAYDAIERQLALWGIGHPA